MDHVQNLLQKLRELKEERKLTNEDIAEMTNLPTTTVARMFSGATKDPRFENIVRVAVALGVSVDRVLGLALPKDETVPPKVETVVESFADVLKVKDDLLSSKNDLISELQDSRKDLRKANFRMTLVIFILAIALGICLVGLSAYLIYDIANGDIGIIRY